MGQRWQCYDSLHALLIETNVPRHYGNIAQHHVPKCLSRRQIQSETKIKISFDSSESYQKYFSPKCSLTRARLLCRRRLHDSKLPTLRQLSVCRKMR